MAEENGPAIRRIEQLIDERHRYYEALFKAIKEQVGLTVTQNAVGLASAKEAVAIAMSAAEKAVTKAESASEKRFESVNEFRAQMADMQATFARTDVVGTRFDVIDKRIEDLVSSRSISAGHSKGVSDLWGWIVAALAMVGIYLHWVTLGK